MNWKAAALRLVRAVSLSATIAAAILTQASSHAEAQVRNSYGGFDIVGSITDFKVNPYSSASGWKISSAHANGKFAYCFGQVWRNSTVVRLGFDAMQWQLAVPLNSRLGEWQGTMEVDGERRFASGVATPGWTIAWLGLRELDKLKRGSRAVLSPGRVDYDFSLAGVTAASLKVQECVERKGRWVFKMPSQQKKTSTPAPASAPVIANCETALSGSYGCSVVQMPPEPSYKMVFQVNGPNYDFINYLVKKVDEVRGEVWISQSGGRWEYMGYWEPISRGSDCIRPSANQSRPVQDALGQDAWMLCVRM